MMLNRRPGQPVQLHVRRYPLATLMPDDASPLLLSWVHHPEFLHFLFICKPNGRHSSGGRAAVCVPPPPDAAALASRLAAQYQGGLPEGEG